MPCVPIHFFLFSSVRDAIWPLNTPISARFFKWLYICSPLCSFFQRTVLCQRRKFQKLAGTWFQRSVLRDVTTRDRSTVCFETMWSTVACLRDVWTGYEFVKIFRIVSSSWYVSNNSHTSRTSKEERSSLQLFSTVNEQWVITFVYFFSIRWSLVYLSIWSVAMNFLAFVRVQPFGFYRLSWVMVIKSCWSLAAACK